MKTNTWLLEFRNNVYSQTGEDGIIEKILDVLPSHDNWCVEFGAWDGLFLTNTRYLIKSKGFSAVLIEANKEKFRKLQDNYSQYSNKVITINRFVDFDDKNNLDQILGTTPIPYNFDILSIDIDGNDYHVWQRIVQYKPKVVVIEFNPTIPMHIKFIQPANPTINQGASLLSIVELGKEKGYELISVLPFNAFFVRKEYYSLFEIKSNTPESLCTDLSRITYLFSGYDGKVFLHGCCRLPWHNIALKQSDVQPLPKYLRWFPENYTFLQKIMFGLFFMFREPRRFIKELRAWFNRL